MSIVQIWRGWLAASQEISIGKIRITSGGIAVGHGRFAAIGHLWTTGLLLLLLLLHQGVECKRLSWIWRRRWGISGRLTSCIRLNYKRLLLRLLLSHLSIGGRVGINRWRTWCIQKPRRDAIVLYIGCTNARISQLLNKVISVVKPFYTKKNTN